MKTLNNQLIELSLKEGDQVTCDGWLGTVFMNQFGLGVGLQTSQEPEPLCDGCFPAMAGLKASCRGQG